MIIVENDNKRLLDALNLAKTSAISRQCIYVPCASYGPIPAIDGFISGINGLFTDSESSVFICGDGDVFILAAGITSKIWGSFKEHLAGMTGEKACRLAEMTTRYSLEMKWDELSAILNKKEAAKKEQEARQEEMLKAQEKEKRKQEIARILTDTELIKTISRRRGAREYIEVQFVEDDPFQRKLVGMALSADFFVFASTDGLSCMSAYISRAPDIVFLDIGLPDISGHDLLKKILKIDPDAYIVMLSANGHRDNILQAIEAGAKGFIGKPFTKEKLFQYISKCSTKNLTKKPGTRT